MPREIGCRSRWPNYSFEPAAPIGQDRYYRSIFGKMRPHVASSQAASVHFEKRDAVA